MQIIWLTSLLLLWRKFAKDPRNNFVNILALPPARIVRATLWGGLEAYHAAVYHARVTLFSYMPILHD